MDYVQWGNVSYNYGGFMVNIKLFSHSSTLIKVVALLKSKPGALCLSSGIWGQLPSKQHTEMNKKLAVLSHASY